MCVLNVSGVPNKSCTPGKLASTYVSNETGLTSVPANIEQAFIVPSVKYDCETDMRLFINAIACDLYSMLC